MEQLEKSFRHANWSSRVRLLPSVRPNSRVCRFRLGLGYRTIPGIRSGQMKEMLQYVQKLRREGDLVEIRSAHTAGSIIRAYGTAQVGGRGVWTG